MATIQEIESALVNAHRAGDTAAAQTLAAELARQKYTAAAQPQEATTFQKVQASIPGRIIQGMRDPIDAGAQFLVRAVPDPVRQVVDNFGNWLNSIGLPVAKSNGVQGVDNMVAQNERDYQAARMATQPRTLSSLITGPEDPGLDIARGIGTALSPVNLAAGSVVGSVGKLIPGSSLITPAAKTVGGQVLRGAGYGAAGGALTPITDTEGDFADKKALQVGMGGVLGGVLGPPMAKFGEVLVRNLNRFATSPEVNGARASLHTDALIRQALAETGQTIDDVPKDVMASIRQEVLNALKQGKKLDAAAMLRQQDAKTVGVQLTQGQLTRDPAQFAKEMNLRGIAGVGDPLMERFTQQNRVLQSRMGELGGNTAQEAVPAGRMISGALQSADKSMQGKVSSLYTAAREAAGKDAEVPLQGLAQDAAQVLEDFGDKVPGAVRSKLQSYGLFGGTQTKVYSPKEAEDLLRVINDHVGSDAATNKALGRLRNAVKASITDADVPDVFKPARDAAAKRFKLHEIVPALEDAAMGKTAPDDFVRKFVLNGKTDDVKGMAELLRMQSPDAFEQARAQMGAELARKAFGENTTGDRTFAAETFNKALRQIGSEKLRAFFTPQEVDMLNALGRVAAYRNTVPDRSTVNFSNSAGVAVDLMRKIPGMPKVVALGNSIVAPVRNAKVVSQALNEQVPTSLTDLPPEAMRAFNPLLAAGGVALGGLAASPLR